MRTSGEAKILVFAFLKLLLAWLAYWTSSRRFEISELENDDSMRTQGMNLRRCKQDLMPAFGDRSVLVVYKRTAILERIHFYEEISFDIRW